MAGSYDVTLGLRCSLSPITTPLLLLPQGWGRPLKTVLVLSWHWVSTFHTPAVLAEVWVALENTTWALPPVFLRCPQAWVGFTINSHPRNNPVCVWNTILVTSVLRSQPHGHSLPQSGPCTSQHVWLSVPFTAQHRSPRLMLTRSGVGNRSIILCSLSFPLSLYITSNFL